MHDAFMMHGDIDHLCTCRLSDQLCILWGSKVMHIYIFCSKHGMQPYNTPSCSAGHDH